MPRWHALSDAQRYPAIPPGRRQLLRHLREHPRAPRWTLACGDRLQPDQLAALADWEQALRAGPGPATGDGQPRWLQDFTDRMLTGVPFYRRRSPPGTPFAELPSTRRADLAAAPWGFVPDQQPLEELLVYPTSGSTGPAFPVYSHPFTASAYLAFLNVVLAREGVALPRDPDRVALACVHWQRQAYTYPSLMSYLGGAGYLKINLAPGEWRTPGDAAAFLNAWAPPVYTGDPYAFARLMELDLRHRPRALISSATALSPAWRATLEGHFGCPVLDFYSLTEARLLAVSRGGPHEVLAHDLFLETLDPRADRAVPPGTRGELAVSGGHNPFLPLLRYRTGDFARLERRAGRTLLHDLEARPPVCLLDQDGAVVNTLDVSRVLGRFPLARLQLQQRADRALTLRRHGPAPAAALRQALGELFGPDLPVTLAPAYADLFGAPR
jgi:phenylacetate-CoA ligase